MGGAVFGADAPATGLAVKDGRILAVGLDDELTRLRGAGTEVVELGGRLLAPGFQDAHIHAVMGGVELGQCDLTGTTDQDEYLRRIAAYAQDHPDDEWIVGGRWPMESFECAVPPR